MRSLLFAILILNSALGFGQEAEFFVEEPTYKFPKTEEGPVIQHTFIVKNTGKKPLVITEAKVSCPCTVVLHPDTIQPGATDSISVSFDTKGKYDFQDRKILLFTNTKKKVEQLRFKVFIIPKED